LGLRVVLSRLRGGGAVGGGGGGGGGGGALRHATRAQRGRGSSRRLPQARLPCERETGHPHKHTTRTTPQTTTRRTHPPHFTTINDQRWRGDGAYHLPKNEGVRVNPSRGCSPLLFLCSVRRPACSVHAHAQEDVCGGVGVGGYTLDARGCLLDGHFELGFNPRVRVEN